MRVSSSILTLSALCLIFLGRGISAQEPPSSKASQEQPLPIIEAKAMALLQKNQQTLFALKMYHAECRTVITNEKPAAGRPGVAYEIATLTAAKPNKMRYDSWYLKTDPAPNGWAIPTTPARDTQVCDGKLLCRQFGSTYQKDTRVAPAFIHTALEPWGGFYTRETSAYGVACYYQKKGQLREARMAGSEMVEGVLCSKVLLDNVTNYLEGKVEHREMWYIGPDSLVHRCVSYVRFDDKPGMTRDATLCNIRVNQRVDPALYVYTPPPGATEDAPWAPAPELLAKGVAAPDFTAQDLEKTSVKLSAYRGKVVVLDFWASWCGPCKASMPHTQETAKKLQQEGLPVVVLAVDNAEERAAFEDWVKTKSAELSALYFVHISPKEEVGNKLFHVTVIPVQYVLDKNGVICASFVGDSGPDDSLEKAIRAVSAKR